MCRVGGQPSMHAILPPSPPATGLEIGRRGKVVIENVSFSIIIATVLSY